MKYTIELTDTEYNVLTGFMDMISTEIKAEYYQKAKLEPTEKAWEDKLAKAKEFAYNDGYNNALDDVNHAIDVLENMTETEREEWFEDYASVGEVVRECTIQRIIKSTKEYEEKKKAEEEIKEGDIVRFNKKSHVYNIQKDREFLVLHVFKDRNLATILYDNGDTSCVELSLVDKTNRHIDEVSQLLDKLRGKTDEKN